MSGLRFDRLDPIQYSNAKNRVLLSKGTMLHYVPVSPYQIKAVRYTGREEWRRQEQL